MTSKRGPENPLGPTTGLGRPRGTEEEWGGELVMTEDDFIGEVDGVAAEWEPSASDVLADCRLLSTDEVQQIAQPASPPSTPSPGHMTLGADEDTATSRQIAPDQREPVEFSDGPDVDTERPNAQLANSPKLEDPRGWTRDLEMSSGTFVNESPTGKPWAIHPEFIEVPAPTPPNVSAVSPAPHVHEQAVGDRRLPSERPLASWPERVLRASSVPPPLAGLCIPEEPRRGGLPPVQARPLQPETNKLHRSAPPPIVGTPSTRAPKPYDDAAPALASYQAFRNETHRLARTRDYRSIAALHESALETAPWADTDELVIKLLLDLARLYRDRIADRDRARYAFERLVARRPGHRESMGFLTEEYEARGDMRSLHDLYARAVDEEWSPDRRVELTRTAARIALDHLGDAVLAATDWERLLELGDTDAQVTVELSQVYREAGRWADLGEFLRNRSVACAGTTRVALLREAAEAHLSGARDPAAAEALISQIVQESPDDPIALASLASVRAHQQRWDELEAVARRPMADVPSAARLDVLRMTAALLAAAGEHDRAAFAYERILNVAPADREAVAAREAHLRRKGDHHGLVSFLVSRADKARSADDRAQLYQRAAEVADTELNDPEMAAELWQKCVSAKPDNATAYNSLVALYDRLDNVEGVTQALDGLAGITREPKTRAAVLRRLGEHYAYRADNDDRAQRCWLEVASLLPDDLAIQRELNGIHRRRGDFAGLDAALTRQMWRTTETQHAVELALEVAVNLDENLSHPSKTVRAWIHVLDLAPDTQDALTVLSNKLQARSNTTEVQGVLETRLSAAHASGDDTAKVDIALQVAGNWEQRGDQLAAIAAYERVRAWAPTDDRVLHALVRLYGKENPGPAVSALEIAASREPDPVLRRELLSRALPLLPDDQARARFFLLHRLLRFDSTSGLGD
ncbi:MAG: hypothetical protein MUF54_07360, partial [Polyangiaceae bacterium]|nr:hypothetical protein [Polyangiaceae bacterium]